MAAGSLELTRSTCYRRKVYFSLASQGGQSAGMSQACGCHCVVLLPQTYLRRIRAEIKEAKRVAMSRSGGSVGGIGTLGSSPASLTDATFQSLPQLHRPAACTDVCFFGHDTIDFCRASTKQYVCPRRRVDLTRQVRPQIFPINWRQSSLRCGLVRHVVDSAQERKGSVPGRYTGSSFPHKANHNGNARKGIYQSQIVESPSSLMPRRFG